MSSSERVEAFFPLGIGYRRELGWILWGLVLSVLYSFGYLFNLSYHYANLFYWDGIEKTLIKGAVMSDFAVILQKSLAGFFIVALCMIPLGIYHYLYHHQGSKSIYLMKRLPDRFDLWRRCLISPLAVIAVCLVLAFVLLVLYYGIYLVVTPAQCLVPGQWQKIWTEYAGGLL